MDESRQEDQEKKSPDALADQLERDADRLEERSEQLAGEIEDVRQDWESNKADPQVPGAVAERDQGGSGGAAAEGEPVDEAGQ